MTKKRIGIVAPSVYILPRHYERTNALVAAHFPDVELVWHPQVFARSPDEVSGNTGFVWSDTETVPDPMMHGHFAGSDEQRTAAFVEMANREDIDAIWFARGGYGAGRIAPDVLPRLGPAKKWVPRTAIMPNAPLIVIGCGAPPGGRLNVIGPDCNIRDPPAFMMKRSIRNRASGPSRMLVAAPTISATRLASAVVTVSPTKTLSPNASRRLALRISAIA